MKRPASVSSLIVCGGALLSACESPVEGDTGGSGGGQAVEAGAATASDWTMLGYDNASTYWNRGETKISKSNVAELDKAWEFDAGLQPTSTPIIAGGVVYYAGTMLSARHLDSGEVIWEVPNPNPGAAAPMAYEDGILYMHDASAVVRAIDATNGDQIWEYVDPDKSPFAQGYSSPVITRDYIIVGGAGGEEGVIQPGGTATFRGFVLAVKKDGSFGWKKFTVEPPLNGVGVWSTVSVDEDLGLVFAGTGNNYTGEAGDTSDAYLAIPLEGGAFEWKRQIFTGDVFVIAQANGNPDADFGANPIVFDVDGRKLVAGGNKGGDVWVLDRESGDVVVPPRNLSPPSAFKGGVFVNGAWDGEHILLACNTATSDVPGGEPPLEPGVISSVLFALDPLTLDIVWERQLTGNVYGWISVANGVGFVPKHLSLQAFDTATGEALFEFETEATVATAPAISDGHVVFGSGMGWIQSTRGTKVYALALP